MANVAAAFGTPTRFAYWSWQATGHILCEAGAPLYHVHCLNLDEMRRKWHGRGEHSILITSDLPAADLSSVLLRVPLPRIAFVDDLQEVILTGVRDRGLDAKDACRWATYGFCALEAVLKHPDVKTFGPEWLDQPLRTFLTALARAVSPIRDAEAAERTLDIYRESGLADSATVWDAMRVSAPGAARPLETIAEMSEADRRLVSEVAGSYRSVLEPTSAQAIHWPRELFFAASPGGDHSNAIDLIGSARHIVWGPYCHLPVGRWKANVTFEVIDNNVGGDFETDVVQGVSKVLMTRAGVMPKIGVYQYVLDFETKNFDQSIEVRVGLVKGSIGGRFLLRSVRLERS